MQLQRPLPAVQPRKVFHLPEQPCSLGYNVPGSITLPGEVGVADTRSTLNNDCVPWLQVVWR